MYKGIVVGDVGKHVVVEVVDENGVAINISSYTGISIIFTRGEMPASTFTLTGAFSSDGTNGKVTGELIAGSTPDYAGVWYGQVLLTKAGHSERTEPFEIEIWKSI